MEFLVLERQTFCIGWYILMTRHRYDGHATQFFNEMRGLKQVKLSRLKHGRRNFWTSAIV